MMKTVLSGAVEIFCFNFVSWVYTFFWLLTAHANLHSHVNTAISTYSFCIMHECAHDVHRFSQSFIKSMHKSRGRLTYFSSLVILSELILVALIRLGCT